MVGPRCYSSPRGRSSWREAPERRVGTPGTRRPIPRRDDGSSRRAERRPNERPCAGPTRRARAYWTRRRARPRPGRGPPRSCPLGPGWRGHARSRTARSSRCGRLPGDDAEASPDVLGVSQGESAEEERDRNEPLRSSDPPSNGERQVTFGIGVLLSYCGQGRSNSRLPQGGAHGKGRSLRSRSTARAAPTRGRYRDQQIWRRGQDADSGRRAFYTARTVCRRRARDRHPTDQRGAVNTNRMTDNPPGGTGRFADAARVAAALLRCIDLQDDVDAFIVSEDPAVLRTRRPNRTGQGPFL